MNNSDELELASIQARIKAFVIDDILMTVLIIFVFWELFTKNNTTLEELLFIMNEFVYQIVFIKFVYHTFFIWYYGATLGKLFAKIKVIDNDNLGKVSFINAAFRSSARVVSEMLFYIGFILAFFNEGKRTFHDMLGRTVVVSA